MLRPLSLGRRRVAWGLLLFTVLGVGIFGAAYYNIYFRKRLEMVQDFAWEVRDRVAPRAAAACPFLYDETVAERRRGIGESSPAFLAPRIAVVTMAIGQQDKVTGDMVVENKRAYCARHGYALEVERGGRVDPSRPIAWTKILLLQHFLNEYDAVAWMDGDALVANSSVRLEDLLDAQHDVYIAADHNDLNTGVIMARRSPWTKWFLKTAWEQTWLVHGDHPFQFEQRAFQYMYGSPLLVEHAKEMNHSVFARAKEVREHFKLVPSCAFNSYRCSPGNKDCANPYFRGHFIMHFAGVPEPSRSYMIRNFLLVRAA